MRFGDPIVFSPGLCTGTAGLPHDFDNQTILFTLRVPDYAIGFMLDASASGGAGAVGAAGTGGGGGGSGESVRQVWFDVTPGDTLTISVPIGGIPGGLAPFGLTDGQAGTTLLITSEYLGGASLIALRGGEGGFAAPTYRGGRCGPNCAPYTSTNGAVGAAPVCHGLMFPFRGLEFLSGEFLRIASGGGCGSDGVNPSGFANCLGIVDDAGVIVRTAYAMSASIVLSNAVSNSNIGTRGGMGGGNIWAPANLGGNNNVGADGYNTAGISNGYMTLPASSNNWNYGGGGGGGGGLNRGGFGGDGFARIRFAYNK